MNHRDRSRLKELLPKPEEKYTVGEGRFVKNCMAFYPVETAEVIEEATAELRATLEKAKEKLRPGLATGSQQLTKTDSEVASI